MEKETRTAIYDKDTGIEVFRFSGFMRPFPLHFHNYYVIGLVLKGKRRLICRGNEHTAEEGDIIIFNPGDVHGCRSLEGTPLEYTAVNLTPETMRRISDIDSPRFSKAVVKDSTLKQSMLSLIEASDAADKEEALAVFASKLINECSVSETTERNEYSRKIDEACEYIEENYAGKLTLSILSDISALSASTFMRAFAKEKGITPHISSRM